MKKPLRIVLTDLNKIYSDQIIADEIGCAASTITRLRNGTQKKTQYEYGERIYDLARRYGVNIEVLVN